MVRIENGQLGVNALVADGGGWPFDAITMELQIPVLNGYGASNVLRTEHGYEGPIVALTAKPWTGTKRSAFAQAATTTRPSRKELLRLD